MAETDAALAELEKEMAAANLRGQWQADATRPRQRRQGPQNQLMIEPVPAGGAHGWRWKDMLPLLEKSCRAMTESHTARRSLVMKNPSLARGTTHTMVAGYQMISPGEIAWAHRHSISALRFVIQGSDKVFTVVDGDAQPMEPYDLVLTPSGCWHDHHNQSDRPAIWLDALDVPFVLGLNQDFYEELGETVQDRNDQAGPSGLLRPVGSDPAKRPMRYAWRDSKAELERRAGQAPDPFKGIALEYLNPLTGGAALPSLACWLQYLPPGFEGRLQRRSSSAIYFVIEGDGKLVCGDQEVGFEQHDSFTLPNWAWHRLANGSRNKPAILFSIHDSPILKNFGLHREESEAAH